MKRLIPSIGALALVALVLPVAASAQDMPQPPEGHAATISGTVIDLSCKFRHT